MKVLAKFILGGAVACIMACLTAMGRPGGLTSFNGQDYLLLEQWGAANGFQETRANGGRGLWLEDGRTRLGFQMNTSVAEINGEHVRLSYPIACQGGQLYISELDVATLIHPLVDPPGMQVRRPVTICVDPGHGGRDTGNRVGSGLLARNEKTYTLALALVLRKELEEAGFRVILTRNRDVYVPLPARPGLANERRADLFVSLHFNASQVDSGSVSGPETYCITPEGAKSSNDHGEEMDGAADTGWTTANGHEAESLILAYEVEKTLVQGLHAPDRDVRRARFAVLRDARMPAILVEGGYMTNPAEGNKIKSAAYREEMARLIVTGIEQYLRVVGRMVDTRSMTEAGGAGTRFAAGLGRESQGGGAQ